MQRVEEAAGVGPERVDLSDFKSSHSFRSKLERVAWGVVWLLLYRPSPRPFHAWRRMLLRWFGARIARGARPHPRARIWLPRNLEMGPYSILADDVDCYCVDRISLGAHAVVSQYAHLCAASHDYQQPDFPLTTAPIAIGAQAWIAAGAFIAPGIQIGDGAVVGARGCVFANVRPWTVVGGNPAAPIKQRRLLSRGST